MYCCFMSLAQSGRPSFPLFPGLRGCHSFTFSSREKILTTSVFVVVEVEPSKENPPIAGSLERKDNSVVKGLAGDTMQKRQRGGNKRKASMRMNRTGGGRFEVADMFFVFVISGG